MAKKFKIRLSRKRLSKIFWEEINLHRKLIHLEFTKSLKIHLKSLENNRKFATYDTGSISCKTAEALYDIALFFRPKVIAEVGTFIGRSALALVSGAKVYNEKAVIHSCDMSNDIDLASFFDGSLVYYPNTTSTQMFKQLSESKISVDLLNLDGRLSIEDIEIIDKIVTEDSIITLDDFEGVEKGVYNSFLLQKANKLKNHVLIYPKNPLKSDDSLGLLIPRTLFAITNQ